VDLAAVSARNRLGYNAGHRHLADDALDSTNGVEWSGYRGARDDHCAAARLCRTTVVRDQHDRRSFRSDLQMGGSHPLDGPFATQLAYKYPVDREQACRHLVPLRGERPARLLQKAIPYAGVLTQWFLSTAGSVGLVLLQFLLTVALAAVMYSRGEAAAEAVVQFGRRVAGERGAQSIKLAAQAIRGVALGVVVTAFIQAGIGGLGVAIAGVPFAPVLCAIMFMLCIAQIGPALVLIPAVIWMFMERELSWAIFLLVCSIVAVGIDNIIRPDLIRKGVDLPLLLILGGVIGGLLGFGLVGIFLGPTILAVGYTLLRVWVAEADQEKMLHVGSVHGSWNRAPILTGRK
jgi:hypothetical protein